MHTSNSILFLFIFCIFSYVNSAPAETEEKISKNNHIFDSPSLDLIKDEVIIKLNQTGQNDLNRNNKIIGPNTDLVEAQMHGSLNFTHDQKQIEERKVNVSEPSIDFLLNKIEENLGKKPNTNNRDPSNIEPSINSLHGIMLYDDPNFKFKNDTKKKMKLNISEPSTNYLENQVFVKLEKPVGKPDAKNKSIEPSLALLETYIHNHENFIHDDHNNTGKTEEKMKKRPILPGYEGFHGAVVHGDEGYYHEGGEKDISEEIDAADMDDYKNWLERQSTVSQLSRFRALQLELNKKENLFGDHDHDRLTTSTKTVPTMQPDHLSPAKIKLLSPQEKLALVIAQLEEEEERKKNPRVDL